MMEWTMERLESGSGEGLGEGGDCRRDGIRRSKGGLTCLKGVGDGLESGGAGGGGSGERDLAAPAESSPP